MSPLLRARLKVTTLHGLWLYASKKKEPVRNLICAPVWLHLGRDLFNDEEGDDWPGPKQQSDGS